MYCSIFSDIKCTPSSSTICSRISIDWHLLDVMYNVLNVQRYATSAGLSQMQLQKSLEHCSNSTKTFQKIPKSLVVQHMRVGAGKILGVLMIFARILPNLPKKTHKKVTYKKKLFVLF